MALGTVGCGDSTNAAGTDAGVDAGPPLTAVDFLHGVASGDPLTDRVILWTRVTPHAGVTAGTATVRWETSATPDFAAVTHSGTFATTGDRDFTVKVDVTGLSANTTYYYRFSLGSTVSPVGRTRTAPAGSVSRVRFAIVSCASYAHGYFHAYRDLATRADLDAVLFLGDYIYEFPNFLYGTVRQYDPPTQIVSLSDYRRRYAWYRRDADLRAAHQQHPWIAVWDDHEFADNAWTGGANNHDPNSEGPWADRKAAAMKAYFEWMPIREQSPQAKIWRQFVYGDLVDLSMLDTRMWARSQQSVGEADPSPTRTLMGDDQEAWLLHNLSAATARWKLIGQQVQMSPIRPDVDLDAWEGYPASRTRLLQGIATMHVSNVVVLTGDIHSAWGMDVALDPFTASAYNPATGTGSLAVEIITSAVTSPSDHPGSVVGPFMAANPQVRFGNPAQRGHCIVDCTLEREQAAWYLLPEGSIEHRETQQLMFAEAWSTLNGANHLTPGGDAAAPRADAPALAPAEPA